jgi:pimeloyl-ACP methyl ester carboxylesterase
MDFGGPVGYRLALKYPERLSALVMQNAPLYPGARLYDIRTNMPTFSAMRELIRGRRPPTLVATGVNDEIFPGDGARNILNDLPEAEFHAVDSGHFALEDKGTEIGGLMREFLDRTVARAS